MTRLFLLLLMISPLLAEPPRIDWELVRNPKTLRERGAPSDLDTVRGLFTDPPAEFRPAPFWVWNDELEWTELERQMRQFKELGAGGVFVHPRPGLITEYLGETWFELWEKSVELGKQLGLGVHIYDENSYPAGFSGGLVPSLAPDTSGTVIIYDWRDSVRGIPWTEPSTVAVFAAEPDSRGQPKNLKRLRPEDPPEDGGKVLLFRIEAVESRAWTGGFPYVDLTDPRTTELFLRTTYEPYRQHLGDEFGKTILWAFSDEPELSKKEGWSGSGLPMDFRVLAEFRRRHGYDLEDSLPSLYWDVGEFPKVRFDYWQLMHDLMLEAFLWPMFLWCDQNGLQWTGHWWEHLWPYPWSSPSDMSYYAFQHVPGIDLLIFGGFDLFKTGASPHMLLTVKQVASVANQLGRPRVLSETFGGGGWRATLEQFKNLGDWGIVHGVNLVNHHLSYVTLKGARKRDWPQSFSDAAAWWTYYRKHADHLGRLSLVAGSGMARNRVLVLSPSTSAFLWARRSDPMDQNPELEAMKTEMGELVQALADHQVDFDLGDEYILDWMGSADGTRLKVGQQAYDVVIVPKNMTNLRSESVELLTSLTRAGGQVIAFGEPPRYVDGRSLSESSPVFKKSWNQVQTTAELISRLRELVPPRVEFDRPVPSGIGFSERILDRDERLLILQNSGPGEVEFVATVAGDTLESWDTETGEITPLEVEAHGDGKVSFRLRLSRAASRVLAVQHGGEPPLAQAVPQTVSPVQESEWQVIPESPNVLVLDFCDLEMGGRSWKDILAVQAGTLIYREHGFDSNPWESAVQYRTTVMDRNRFGTESGFKASFHFHIVDAGALSGIELAVESPQLYGIQVNGQTIDFTDAPRWLDKHLVRASIQSAARVGENRVEIVGKPFDVRMELESVYVLGSFSVLPSRKGFELHAPRGLTFGSWASQQRPFDGGSVLYSSEFDAVQENQKLRLELGRWRGSLVEVLLDGVRLDILGWPPWEMEVPVASGRHKISIRVVGTPGNVLGPFHDPRPCCDRVLWPGHWTLFAHISQPDGSGYEVEDYGLFEPPKMSLISRGPTDR